MKKRIAFAAIFISVFLFTSAPALAAEEPGIKPGSFFYGFVTTFEKINLFFTFSPEKKAEKALKYAEKRLAEAESVAGDENSEAVKTAIAGYEKNIALAAEASKKVKDEARAENLLTLIASSTSKHQEVLSAVLIKVPEEAKEAITKALEASRKGQEEALKQVAELKGEVEQLKQEVAGLKANGEQDITELNKSDLTKKELEELRNLLLQERKKREELENRIQKQSASITRPEIITPQQNSPRPKTFTLSSGVVVDEYGNIISIPESKKETQPEDKKLTAAEIASRVIPAIVQIKTFTTDSGGSGSGVIIESDGLILTAAHVVQGFSIVQVALNNGKTYNGKVLGRDDFNDIALVRISTSNLPVVPLGDSDDIKVGEDVLVFGHPLGLSGAVLSKGILNGRQPGKYFVWLQTDAKTQGGSSGGAWVNKEGRAIGVHVLGLGPKIQGIKVNEGFNFSVPINFVKTLLPSLKQGQNKIDYTLVIPSAGSKVEIKRAVKASADFNPGLQCDQLGTVSTSKDLFLCKLYRVFPDKYIWEIVDEYSSDSIGQQDEPNALLQPAPPAGSTIKISKTTIASIAFNPTLTCDQLGILDSEKDACKLYKSNKGAYTWEIIEN